MASGVLPGTGRGYLIDVEDSKPLYVQRLFDFAKGRRRGIDWAAAFGGGNAESILRATGVRCESLECHSRNSLQLAGWGFLCLSQCLCLLRKIRHRYPL